MIIFYRSNIKGIKETNPTCQCVIMTRPRFHEAETDLSALWRAPFSIAGNAGQRSRIRSSHRRHIRPQNNVLSERKLIKLSSDARFIQWCLHQVCYYCSEEGRKTKERVREKWGSGHSRENDSHVNGNLRKL